MAHRKEERKKAIDDVPDLPGGPFWRRLGPYGPFIPLIPLVAKEVAKLMIEHEEKVGLGHGPKFDETVDWDAVDRRAMQEARWAAMEQEPKPVRKKRKVSDYSKQFGIILKALKKKHPRTPVTRLMKRAHVATRKKMPKKKPGRSAGRKRIKSSGQFRRDKLLPRRK